ncbi:hypothetical protein [Methylobacterium mesophilicum]|uniref:hypothetical protein n=1 Tax=Methylobacterium mesophilicum TaxID=39956 RepID=UPI002F353DF7
MVVHPPRLELDRHTEGLRGRDQGQERGAAAEAVPDAAIQEPAVEPEEQHGPEGRRQTHGKRVARQGRERQDQAGDRRVDEARPVARHAARGQESVLDVVVPALAGQQVAHFHEAHRVVGVRDAEVVDRLPHGMGGVHRRDAEGGKDPQQRAGLDPPARSGEG